MYLGIPQEVVEMAAEKLKRSRNILDKA